MRKQYAQKGFTLVELAIVMTIIGLLIGGILKGQELMNNARVTATIAQVKGYDAAVTTFRDKYDSTPGDMKNASTRIPGCSTACDANSTTAGDGIVGALDYAGTAGTTTATFTNQTTAPLASGAAASTVVGFETNLFWVHLLQSDLISGVTNASVNGGTIAWSETNPAGKIGGGFVAGYGNGVPGPGSNGLANTGPNGTILVLLQSPTTGTNATMIAAGNQPLSATRAAQIDRKMDDGRPASGSVQAYGDATSCFSVAAPFSATAAGYLESAQASSCGLIFRIQS